MLVKGVHGIANGCKYNTPFVICLTLPIVIVSKVKHIEVKENNNEKIGHVT